MSYKNIYIQAIDNRSKRGHRLINKSTEDNFFKLVKSRKTTYEFTDKKIKDADIKKILEAARWAPSCSNVQPWHFIVVKDKKRISDLMKLAFYGAFHSPPPGLLL